MSTRSVRRIPSDFGDGDAHDSDHFLAADHWDNVPDDPKKAIPHIIQGLKTEKQVRRRLRMDQKQAIEGTIEVVEDHTIRLRKIEDEQQAQRKKSDSIMVEQKTLTEMVTEMHTAMVGNKMGTTGLVARMENVEKDVRILKNAKEAEHKVQVIKSKALDNLSKVWPIIATLIGLAGAALGISSAF